jgi:hypothetical protein
MPKTCDSTVLTETRCEPFPAFGLGLLLALQLVWVGKSHGELTAISSFNPSQTGDGCGIGFDGGVWVHGCSSGTIDNYTSTGTTLPGISRPGESANDVDVEFAPEDLVLGSTSIPAGTLLFINGESGTAIPSHQFCNC